MPDSTLLVDGDFILIRTALVDALDGDYPSAILVQRIAWRCERHGEWQATQAELAEETHLSLRSTERRLPRLVEAGWLARRRAGPHDPTSVWSLGPRFNPPGGDHVSAETAVTVTAETAVTSLKTVETTTPLAAASAGQEVTLHAEQPPLLPDLEPPKPLPTAGTLVDAWCGAWSAAHRGKQPPPTVVRRVAGKAAEVARGRPSLEEWRRAWRAAADAGRRGRWDFVAQMADEGQPSVGEQRYSNPGAVRLARALAERNDGEPGRDRDATDLPSGVGALLRALDRGGMGGESGGLAQHPG